MYTLHIMLIHSTRKYREATHIMSILKGERMVETVLQKNL